MSKSTRRVSHNTCLLDYITRCLFITEIRIIRFKLTDSSHAAKAVFAKAVPTVIPRGRRWPQEGGGFDVRTEKQTFACVVPTHRLVFIKEEYAARTDFRQTYARPSRDSRE